MERVSDALEELVKKGKLKRDEGDGNGLVYKACK